MRPVECFKTYDGRLFENEEQALAHADDILGEELDGLLRIGDHNMTRNEEYKFLISLLKNRKALRVVIFKLADILKYELNGE